MEFDLLLELQNGCVQALGAMPSCSLLNVSLMRTLHLGFPLERAPDESLVLDVQSALWNSGFVRAAGAVDILIAAYAIVNDATVLTADHDFDHIAQVTDLQHEYVAPSA